MSFQAPCSEESPSLPSSGRLDWPNLTIDGESYKTEFSKKDGWKCPLCRSTTKQIRNHLRTRHQEEIQDWETLEDYCNTIAVLKRKETLRKADAKRLSNPERKEAQKKLMKKKDANRAGKPERKEAKRQAMKKVDAKRAGKPERK